MIVDRKETKAVTVILTLTEQEANDLLFVAGFDTTVPKAIKRSTRVQDDGDRAERILQALYNALEV